MKNLTLVILSLLMLLAGCSKDGINEPDDTTKEVIISDKTIVLDDEIKNNLELKDSLFSFSIPKNLISSKKIDVNDVLVTGISPEFPNGFLRKIDAINESGNNAIITTSQGTLKDVIEQGSVSVKKSLGKSNLVSIQLIDGAKLTNNSVLNKSNMIGINWDYEKDIYSSGNNKVTVRGNLAFNFDANFDLTIDFLQVEYFKTSLEINQNISMNFKSNFSKDLTNIKVPFAKAFFTPITFSIGIVPVVIVPEVTLYLGADGTISTNSELWFRESFNGEYGIKYTEKNGWTKINEDKFTLEKELPNINGAGNFSAYVGPKASLKLYGVAGPYLTFDAYTELESKLKNTKLEYNYAIGFRSNAGVQVELFGWDLLSYNDKIFEKVLFSYNSESGGSGDSFRLTNPANDQTYILGDFINLTTFYSGTKPTSVKFFVDGIEKSNDLIEPFEYTLNTTSLSEGEHTLKAVANYGTKTNESSVKIKLLKPVWTKIDMSSLLDDSDIIHKITFVNENLGFAVGGGINHSLILKTTDGGNTWNKVLSLKTYDDNKITDIAYVNSEEIYAVREDNLFLSKNNGNSWEKFIPPGEIHSRIGGTKIAITSEGLIVTSYNSSMFIKTSTSSGALWFETYPGGPENPFGIGDAKAVKYLNDKKIIVLDGKDLNSLATPKPHQVLISNDGGFNWKKVILNIPFTWEPQDMDFSDENNGWIVGHSVTNDRGFVLKTTNGGDSWSVLHNPNDEKLFPLYAVDFLDFKNGFTSGTLVDIEQSGLSWKQGILSSNNGGELWSNNSLKDYNPNGQIRTVFFLSRTKGWAAGSHKTLYKYTAN